MTRDMDICQRTSDNAANFPVCAGICLSHLNSNHANIAAVPNGFYCTVIAECTNSYGVNESFFFFSLRSRKTKFSFTSPSRIIWGCCFFVVVFLTEKWFLWRLIAAMNDWSEQPCESCWATPCADPKSWDILRHIIHVDHMQPNKQIYALCLINLKKYIFGK